MQRYINLDTVAGFEASRSLQDERYCQIGEEVLLIDGCSTISPAVDINRTMPSDRAECVWLQSAGRVGATHICGGRPCSTSGHLL